MDLNKPIYMEDDLEVLGGNNEEPKGPQFEGVEIEEEGKSFAEILKTRTGTGDIDDYKSNPLNFDKSEEVAQVLRGLTGFIGDLNLAVVDIVVGFYRLFVKKKAVKEMNNA